MSAIDRSLSDCRYENGQIVAGGDEADEGSWEADRFGLMALGFSEKDAQAAMVQASGDIGTAMDLLEAAPSGHG